MADALGDGRRRGTGKRAAAPLADATAGSGPTPAAPCGACKFLRRKCISGCIFAPHFGSDQGAARFAAVHKVFGASNVSKLLLHIPVNRRHDAVVTISYEAQARLSDPVYGCVSTILALQQQVASLQAELAMVQSQLMGGRLAAANAYNNLHQQQMHPAYSNNSAASNNNNLTMSMSVGLIHNNNTMSSGATTFNSNLELTSAETFPPLQLSRHPHSHDDDEDDQDSPTHSLPFPLHAL